MLSYFLVALRKLQIWDLVKSVKSSEEERDLYVWLFKLGRFPLPLPSHHRSNTLIGMYFIWFQNITSASIWFWREPYLWSWCLPESLGCKDCKYNSEDRWIPSRNSQRMLQQRKAFQFSTCKSTSYYCRWVLFTLVQDK